MADTGGPRDEGPRWEAPAPLPRRQSRTGEPGTITTVILTDALACALWALIAEHTGGYFSLWGRADSNEIPESPGHVGRREPARVPGHSRTCRCEPIWRFWKLVPCASRGSGAYLQGHILTAEFLLLTTTAKTKNQPAFPSFSVCLLVPVERVPPKWGKKPSPYFLILMPSLGIEKWCVCVCVCVRERESVWCVSQFSVMWLINDEEWVG